MPYVTDYTAILNADPDLFRWNGIVATGAPVFVTYGFLSAAELPDFTEHPPFDPEVLQTYIAMDAVRMAATRLALQAFEAVCGVKFIEVAAGDDAAIQLLANDSASG